MEYVGAEVIEFTVTCGRSKRSIYERKSHGVDFTLTKYPIEQRDGLAVLSTDITGEPGETLVDMVVLSTGMNHNPIRLSCVIFGVSRSPTGSSRETKLAVETATMAFLLALRSQSIPDSVAGGAAAAAALA
jgi:hypothetical protein